MKNFTCSRCGSRIYFGNITCVKCKCQLGFDPTSLAVVSLTPVTGAMGVFQPLNSRIKSRFRYCANFVHGTCNWLTMDASPNGLCVACKLNRTIPNLAEQGSLPAWRDLERAKKRLVYSLLRFGLSLDASSQGKGRLAFDFVRNAGTGHLHGLITIDLIEADSVERERQRQQLDEPYRSLLGHLRHESGHFYWMTLIESFNRLEDFRALFGDERQDYSQSLDRHYAQGPQAGWQDRFISAYASSHPWEDWAETWAHYLHMVDALDTAEAEGMEPRTAGFSLGSIWPFKSYDIYREETFQVLMDRWVPLTLALNSLSRSMGNADFYPFVISTPAYEKLAFIHTVIRDAVSRTMIEPRRQA